MIEYLVEGRTFSFNYQELKEEYEKICEYTPQQFLDNVVEILHFTCFISYIKNTPSYILLNDKGLIHELVHLIHLKDLILTDINEVMNQFKIWCKLS